MKYTLTLESDNLSAIEAIRKACLPQDGVVYVGDVLGEHEGWRGTAEARWKEIEQVQAEKSGQAKRIVELEQEIVRLKHEIGAAFLGGADSQFVKLEQENQRLQKALAPYADPNNWQCNRCKGQDHVNCFMGRYVGPCGDHLLGCGDGDTGCFCDLHGYTIAQNALAGGK